MRVTVAFRIEGEDRKGRWLVTCDHASNRVPTWVGGGNLGIPAADMARHIAWDVGAAGVASELGRLLEGFGLDLGDHPGDFGVGDGDDERLAGLELILALLKDDAQAE